MSDAAIQSRLRVLIRALSNFADADVTLGDNTVLGRGSAPYAIIYPGAMSVERDEDQSRMIFTWQHRVEIWDRFLGDDYSGITTARQAVLDMLGQYPTLNDLDLVRLVTAASTPDPQYLYAKDAGLDELPQFVGFPMTVVTVEDYWYSAGEF